MPEKEIRSKKEQHNISSFNILFDRVSYDKRTHSKETNIKGLL